MPTGTTIPTAEVFALGQARVSTATTLATGTGWTAQPYLYCDRLQLTASPDMSQAVLRWEYGDFVTREADLFTGAKATGTYVALDVIRHYVKVEVMDGDARDDPVAATARYTWYGRIVAIEDNKAVIDNTDTPTGTQILHVLGLESDLEDVIVMRSRVTQDGADNIDIGRALAFNMAPVGVRDKHGNRHFEKTTDYNGYVFSEEASPEHELAGDEAPEPWKADEAATYLLEYFSPRDKDDTPSATWRLVNGAALAWFDVEVPCDRRSLKSILDSLIDRRRICAYVVEGEEESSTFYVNVRVFTFNNEAISVSSGEIPANEDLIEFAGLHMPTAISVVVGQVATSQIDVIRVEGAPITSTFTLQYSADPEKIVPGWTTTAEGEYVDANGETTPEAADLYRIQDSYADVFARFVLGYRWDQKVTRQSDDAEFFVVLDPKEMETQLEAGLDDSGLETLFAVATDKGGKWWHNGHLILPYLAVKDEDSKEYRRPFVLFQDDESATKYHFADKLNLSNDPQYEFAVHVFTLHDRPGFRLQVTRAAGQQLIAKGVFTGTDYAPDDTNPFVVAGVDYRDMLATVTMEWDDRCYVEQVIDDTRDVLRKLVIQVPDARLDFEIPGTVTDIDGAGALVESTGRVLRNDTERLRDIAKAAAEWYGETRRTLRVAYGDIVPVVAIGDLIVELGYSTTLTEAVNTPVTGITYDFLSGVCAIETSYADADFS